MKANIRNQGVDVLTFAEPYSQDKINEGRAVHWAVLSGACDSCKYLRDCENGGSNEWNGFPQDAPCEVKRRSFENDSD